ncbi:MAG: histidine phosphatase family protein [Alphaproteobacteria bacterium]
MTDLALIRHGPTAWNEQGFLQGRQDLPLSKAGQAEVQQWRLPALFQNFTWVSSPLRRCRQTAAILGADDPRLEPRLIEIDWGDWEGPEGAVLRADTPRRREAEGGGLDLAPPGGESPRQVQQRLRPWLQEVADAGTPTLACAHKGIIRAIYALATGWPMLGKPQHQMVWDCVQLFTLDSHGHPAIERLNIPLTSPAPVVP